MSITKEKHMRDLKKLAFYQTNFNRNNLPRGLSLKDYESELLRLQKNVDTFKKTRVKNTDMI